MRLLLGLALTGLSAAHLGEAVEAHSAVEIFLGSPAMILAVLVILVSIGASLNMKLPPRWRHRPALYAVFGAVSLILIAMLYLSLTSSPAAPHPYHTHADFKVFLNGTPFNFSQERFMSTNVSKKSDRVHLHDMDGDVIHHHARNITLADFFSSLNMTFNSSCFITDDGTSYCDSGAYRLRMFVQHQGGSWMQDLTMERYVFEDLDRILIFYGPEEAGVSGAEAAVTDKACIQSEKCPERGKATDSTCAGDVCLVD
ncbi:MAG: hypothetical protein U0R44_02740 [Candidatus Micrarchaeia archaeon]